MDETIDEEEILMARYQGHFALTLIFMFAWWVLRRSVSRPKKLPGTPERNGGLDCWRRLCTTYCPSKLAANMCLLKKVLQPKRVNYCGALACHMEIWETVFGIHQDRTSQKLTDATACDR